MAFSSTDQFLDTPSQSPKALARQQRKKTHKSAVIEPRNAKQATLLELFKKFNVVFALGSAGSGKTYLGARYAYQQLLSGAKDRLVMSRATASAQRHKLGFLPGTDAQKMAPWLVPIMSALRESAGAGEMEKFQNEKKIETLPFEHMQGRTIKDGVFLLDEAQNCTFSDLEMFITRIGENAQIIICGDQDQVVPGIDSGLMDIVKMVEDYGLDAGVVIFDENDVVRSETAAAWVKAFKLRRQTHDIGFLRNAA